MNDRKRSSVSPTEEASRINQNTPNDIVMEDKQTIQHTTSSYATPARHPNAGTRMCDSSASAPPTLSEANLDCVYGNSRSTTSESPVTSQVSVGSVPPMLTASLMPARHLDLTPIMRNTSTDYPPHAWVSPSEDALRGEDLLAMPSDLQGDEGRRLSMPPIRRVATHSAPALAEPPTPPIDFSAAKHYSFTSHEQYEQVQQQAHQHDYDHDRPQYQPIRRDSGLQVGSLPEEELSRIFLPRRTSQESDESHQHHRLDRPLSMDERQLSIPSIRLAHHLQSSTTASYTDEEDSIVHHGDEFSLGSRSFPEELLEPSSVLAPRVLSDSCKRYREQQAYEWLQSLEANSSTVAEAASSKFLTSRPPAAPLDRQVSTPVPRSHHEV